MSLETMTKLASTTVGVGGSSSLTFSNIPQGYTDLCIKISCRTSRAADEDGLGVQLNSTTTGYTYRVLAADGASATSVNTAYGELWTCRIQGASPGTSVFSSTELYLPNYSENQQKMIFAESVTEKGGTNGYITSSAVAASVFAPVTSITLSGLNAPFQQYSTFTLYGIKNAAKTAGNSIKATGGNIVFDGTYVYHVFNSTGAFVPTQPLTADVLVVAGGGGVSTNNNGVTGGGGAGGVIYFARQSLASASSYPCTIGGGGAASTNGTNGSDSSFASLTSAVGGGSGGGWSGNAPGNGGSGGGTRAGSGGSSTQTGTGATAYYGNAGGTGNNFIVGGGGGGAGAAGGNASADYAATGVGGNGTSAFSSWGIGESISGTYYLAGGGAGYGASVGGYGGGGNSSHANGTPNTGGGGTVAGSGGSGIVIIRYKG